MDGGEAAAGGAGMQAGQHKQAILMKVITSSSRYVGGMNWLLDD